MNHLMRTVNPEAVDAIESGVDSRFPSVGARVLFRGRLGWTRGMRDTFPADVLKVHDGGLLDLHVIYEAGDTIVEEKVSQRTPGNEHYCWEPIQNPGEALGAPVARLNNLRRDLDHLRELVLGEYLDPPKSVLDHLSDFEDRLNQSEARLAVLEGRLAALDAKA